jgi:glycosyltransferase involved in cell wall biosynthesis
MSERPRRTVLVLAYFFPPHGGAGVQRTLKFVKYLPEYGYDPVVVTTRAADYEARDPSLLAEVPPRTRLVRAPDPALLRWAITGFDYLGWPLLRALAGWPDPAAAWIPAATVSAIAIARRQEPDVIFSSAPPFSAHVAASLAARATGIPWVADFRDEFTANPSAEWRTDLIQSLNLRLEPWVLRHARRIVTAAEYFEIGGVPRDSQDRVTITNGVDPADLDPGGEAGRDAAPASAQDRFRLSFVGTLYGELDLGPVADALARLAGRGVLDPSLCELRLVGNVWLSAAPDAGAVPVVQTGYRDHASALQEMGAASVLVLYVPSSSPAPTGKLYEYLASERPILCVTRRDNVAFRLVQEWDAGRSVEPADADGIEAAIAELYAAWRDGTLRGPAGVRGRVLERYSRRSLTGELAAALDAAVSAAGGSRPASR